MKKPSALCYISYNCRISTQKDTLEEIRKIIKRKLPLCAAKSGKRKLYPLSLHVSVGPQAGVLPTEPPLLVMMPQ